MRTGRERTKAAVPAGVAGGVTSTARQCCACVCACARAACLRAIAVVATAAAGVVAPALTGAMAQTATAPAPPAPAAALSPALSPILALLPALLVTALSAIAIAVLVLRLAGRKARKRAGRHVEQLEARLAEADALLTAEPQLLIVWKGKGDEPYRRIGDLRGIEGVPREREEQFNYAAWLDASAALELHQKLSDLRQHGAPFNIHVSSRKGRPLEADGRAAGGMATLRIRPVEGERLGMARLEQVASSARAEMKAARDVLDSAPMPIWLNQPGSGLAWANRAYLDAIGADDLSLAPRDRDPEAMLGDAAGDTGLDIVQLKGKDATGGIALMARAGGGEPAIALSAHASALELLETPVAIFSADRRLRFFNRAYAELWQLDPDWLAKAPGDGDILDALREARRVPEQVDYRAWREERLSAWRTAQGLSEDWHLPDGRTIQVTAEKHPSGGLIHIYEDTTGAIALETRLNTMIGVQKETLDNLHEGVALFGSDGRLKLFNPAYGQIWDLPMAELGREPHISKVIDWCRALHDDPATWDELKWAVTSLDDERRPLHGRIARADETVIAFASVPLPDGATLLTYVDMTDTTRIERALRERNDALETANTIKSNFVSHVSYQLRQPLTNIIGFAESLALGIAGDLTGNQKSYVQNIRRSGDELITIVDDILDLTTIDAGAMELDLKEIRVRDVMTQAVELVKPRIGEKSLKLHLAIPADAGSFMGDEKRVKQILYNLLTNAIGFSPEGGAVNLTCRRDSDELTIAVRDNGPGIRPDQQEEVFERFETHNEGSDHRGAGLGLAVVDSFVKLHGGTVTLHSLPGTGTTVECHFPLSAKERPAHESEQTLPRKRAAAG